jgi:hypothetical protein
MWIIILLVIRSNPHPTALAHPSTLEVLRAKECTPTPYSFIVFIFGLVVESIKEFGGALIEVNAKCQMFWLACIQTTISF